MNFNIVTGILVVAISISGCATSTPLADNQVRITYTSEPPGALLYDGYGPTATAWGIAPQTRRYTFPRPELRATLAQVTAVWPSGAKKTESFNVSVEARTGEYTLSRPIDAPGLDKDLAYAAQIKANKAQADTAGGADWSKMFDAFNRQMQDSKRTDCISTISGDMVNTSCR